MAPRRLLPPLMFGCVVSLLAGCSIGAGVDTPTQSGPTTGSIAKEQLVPPPPLDKVNCVADKSGSWSFSAEVINSEKSEQKFEVTASVMDTKTWKVVAEKKMTVTVAAGKKSPVSAKAFHRSKKSATLQCQARTSRSSS